jgi:hypothetical protein
MPRHLIINFAAAVALTSTAFVAGSAAAYPLSMSPYAPHTLNKPIQTKPIHASHIPPYTSHFVIAKPLPQASPASKWKIHPPITTISVPKPKIIVPTPNNPPTPKAPPQMIPVQIPIGIPSPEVDMWHQDQGVGVVQTTVEGLGNCLTKTYTPDGQVVFEDLCTREIVTAPVDNALSQISEVPAKPNYAGETYQDYLAANPQIQATQQKN